MSEKSNLINELNNEKDIFMSLANKNTNPFFHISDIYFKSTKKEMYIGQLPVIIDMLEIILQRAEKKNKNHIIIDIDNPECINKLNNWYLSKEMQVHLFKEISKHSSSLKYIEETSIFINKY